MASSLFLVPLSVLISWVWPCHPPACQYGSIISIIGSSVTTLTVSESRLCLDAAGFRRSGVPWRCNKTDSCRSTRLRFLLPIRTVVPDCVSLKAARLSWMCGIVRYHQAHHLSRWMSANKGRVAILDATGTLCWLGFLGFAAESKHRLVLETPQRTAQLVLYDSKGTARWCLPDPNVSSRFF